MAVTKPVVLGSPSSSVKVKIPGATIGQALKGNTTLRLKDYTISMDWGQAPQEWS